MLRLTYLQFKVQQEIIYGFLRRMVAALNLKYINNGSNRKNFLHTLHDKRFDTKNFSNKTVRKFIINF